MRRLIDIDELYDKLFDDVTHTNDIDNHEYDLFLEYLDAAPVVNRWIALEQQVPEMFLDVIVHYESGIIDCACRFPVTGFLHKETRGRVTHWMPLPEPPETET